MQLGSSPIVSVIIIVFNGAQYIRGAIESVFNQTFKDWEIVIVDDGSTDNTKSVLEPWIKEGRIRYLYQQNKGPSGAYNTGVRLAKGKFVKFLDCDDSLYPKQLEIQVNHLQNKPEEVVSVTDFEFEFDGQKRKNGNLWLENQDRQLAQFIKDNPCPGHTILISRNLIERSGGYDEELFSYEDSDLWVRALLQGAIFEKLDYVGCCYRIVGGSVSSDPEKMFRQRCKFYEKLNRIILPKSSQIKGNVLRQLLSSNTMLIDMCFARKINPAYCIPAILEASSKIYAQKVNKLRKLFLETVGFKNIAKLKYIKNCLINRNYHSSLLTTLWRNEENYT
jgi:glycosyltransferase involved in cell wall biosynthesis